MKRSTAGLILAVTMILAISFASAATAALPSSKATVNLGNITKLNNGVKDMGWKTILKSELKTPNQKDLLMDVSLECGLYTQTKVSSQKGTADTSFAKSGVQVQVLVDGKAALPGPVIFCDREQTLTAEFGGILQSCTDQNGDGVVTVPDECTFTDETLNLILKTMNANSFNFAVMDLPPAVHTIEVQAQISSKTTVQSGTADAYAMIGKGSLAVEEVRMVKGLNPGDLPVIELP